MPADLTSLAAPERNHYFYGLMMDADRFRKDQNYFIRKRMLLNRFSTGAGVVCGLGLNWNSATSTLTLSPGLAIDYDGREIVVPSAATVDITTLTDVNGNPAGPVPAGSTIIVSLAYAEKTTDPVPVLVPDCDHPNGCASSTIEEDFVLLVRVASGPPPPIPSCAFGSFPLPPGSQLWTAIANQVAGSYAAPLADPSVPLGRLDLTAGTLDAVSDRPVVYDNGLLFQLIFCVASQVSQLGTLLTYVSGDNQSAAANTALANPLVVALVDSSGNPVTSGSPPTFTVTAGGGSVGPVTPGAPGQYQTAWTLGGSGAQTITAQSAQSSITVTFNATIEP